LLSLSICLTIVNTKIYQILKLHTFWYLSVVVDEDSRRVRSDDGSRQSFSDKGSKRSSSDDESRPTRSKRRILDTTAQLSPVPLRQEPELEVGIQFLYKLNPRIF
jgi:hypothetical protein